MKYFSVDFFFTLPAEELCEAVSDVVSAIAGETGFETFEQTDEGLRGYVQTQLFSREALDEALLMLPFEGVTVGYAVSEAEDRDWNETWEQEGFEPIVVSNVCVVHDGRHTGDRPLDRFPLSIEIDTRLAFGTGSHQTTRLMLQGLLSLPLQGRRALDCGCGTGILAIAALKSGAERATAYDIDEWSTDNTRHNAVINGVDSRLTILLGDATVLQGDAGEYDVVMANINRNVLLADLPAFAAHTAPGGTLLLSGFLEEDVPLLSEAVAAEGLRTEAVSTENGWACLKAIK